MRTVVVLLFSISIVLALLGQGWAASDQAMKLRNGNGLTEYSPPEAFLNGNFVADEIDPTYIFGKVEDFAKGRSCPISWLIDDGGRKSIQGRDQQSGPVEYTLFLEEDCPGKVAYYVFVDRSQASSAQWMEWRKQFHKNKVEQQYAKAKAGLEAAAQSGFQVDAELRFVEVGGDLQLKKPEDILTGELKIKPVYDLKQGKAIEK